MDELAMDELAMEALGFGRSAEACLVCGVPGLWVDPFAGWEACERCMEIRRRGHYADWPPEDLDALYAERFGPLAPERRR